VGGGGKERRGTILGIREERESPKYLLASAAISVGRLSMDMTMRPSPSRLNKEE